MAVNNKIEVHITAENEQFVSKMQEVIGALHRADAEAKSSGSSMKSSLSGGDNLFGGMIGGLAKVNMAAMGVVGVLREIKDVAASIVMPGYEFAKNMESSKLGMAGTLVSMGQINGEAIDFNDAMDMASRMMDKLNVDAIKTAASTQELVTTFQGLLAPGLGAGMNLEQIRQYVVVGVNAAKSMNLDNRQFIQELRDLVQGGIQPSSSTIAASLGLTDADITAARGSADGLFKFLMDRLEGFRYSAEAYPATFAGTFDQIKEYATLASSKIEETFGGEIKEYARDVASAIGTVNEESGSFEVNPAILEFIDDLNTLYIWILQVYDGVVNFFRAISDTEAMTEIIGLCGDLWDIIKEVCHIVDEAIKAIGQFFRALGNNAIVISLIKLVRGLVNELKSLASIAGIAWSKSAEAYEEENDALLGHSNEKSHTAQDAETRIQQNKEAIEAERQRRASTPDESSEVTSKYQQKQQEQQRSALRSMLQMIKDNLDAQLAAYKDSLEKINVLYKQGEITWQEAAVQEAEINAAKEQAVIDNLNQRIAAVSGSGSYKDDTERQAALQPLINELSKHEEALRKSTETQQYAADVIAAYSANAKSLQQLGANPAATTAAIKQAAGTFTGDLGKQVVQAGQDIIDSGATYDDFVCTQFVVKSWDAAGLEDALHAAGIDTTDDDSRDMRSWVPALMETAKKLGAWIDGNSDYQPAAGDGIVVLGDDHVVMSTGNGNEYMSSSGHYEDGTAKPIATYDDYFDAYNTPTGYISLQKLAQVAGISATNNAGMQLPVAGNNAEMKIKEEAEKAQKAILNTKKSFLELMGDISTVPIMQAIQESEKKIRDYRKQGLETLAQEEETILTDKKLNLWATQDKNNLDAAMKNVTNNANDMYYKISAGMFDAGEAAQKYIDYINVDNYGPKIWAQLADLERQRSRAVDLGDMKLAAKIQEDIDGVKNSLASMLDKFRKAVEDRAAWQDNMIDSSFWMTSGQKERAKQKVNTEKYAAEQEVYQKQLKDGYRKLVDELRRRADRLHKANSDEERATINQDENNKIGTIYAKDILPNSRQIAYLDQLKQIPPLLERIRMAAKQSLEDGLVTFLTDGISQAGSLGDALRDLASGILKSMQKVFATDIVNSLMDKWYPQSQAQAGDISLESATAQANLLGGTWDGILGDNTSFMTSFQSQMVGFESALQSFYAQVQASMSSATSATIAAGASAGAAATGGYDMSFGVSTNLLDASGHADGGLISGPGTGTSDSIFSRLSNGEFVVKAAAVKKYGIETLRRINEGTFSNLRVHLPAFSHGGMVGFAGADAAGRFTADLGANLSTPVSITNYVDGRRVANTDLIRTIVQKENSRNAKLNSVLQRRF